MSYMKEIALRIAEICRVCGSKGGSCNNCKMKLQIKTHENKKVWINVENGHFVGIVGKEKSQRNKKKALKTQRRKNVEWLEQETVRLGKFYKEKEKEEEKEDNKKGVAKA